MKLQLSNKSETKKDSKPLSRRRGVLVSGGGVVIVAIGWWFGWMTPEAAKLTSVHVQEVAQQQLQEQLTLQLDTLKGEARQVRTSLPLLHRFEEAIPAKPEAPDLVVSIYNLATSDNVDLQTITDNSVSAAGSGYSTIPISLAVSGSHDGVEAFISGLYGLPRLITVQTVSLSGSGNVNSSASGTWTASISATAYTTSIPSAATAS
jgi:type IV pilus assembly protein PilO